MKGVLVSILIPIYGVEKYIKRCAESLLGQTYQNIEYIFVNDCTKDKSIKILKEVIDCYPNREGQIKIINHEQNRGLAAARNTAVENAHGDFILHVDSDDYVATNIVEKLVKKQVETNADIVCTDLYRCVDQNKEEIKYPYDENNESFIRNIFYGKQESWIWGKLIRKRLYVDNAIKVEEGCNMAEDFQVLPRLAYFSNRIAYVKEPLYFYECSNASSYCKKVNESQKMQQWRSFDILYSFFEQSQFLNDLEYSAAEMVYFHLKAFVQKNGLSDDFFVLLKKRWECISCMTKLKSILKYLIIPKICFILGPKFLRQISRVFKKEVAK